ncbi:MAG: DUF4174 domain-containing protein [Akkermansiaceae bacterium]
MKILTILAFLTMTVAAQTLDDFQGKMRLLVVTESNDALSRKLVAEQAGLADRDIEIFVLKGPAAPGKYPGATLGQALRKRMNVRDGVAEVLLLGKDGRTTLRWSVGDFSIASLFAKIDAMPMRIREMQDR